jgi:hypothetical protein
MLVVGAAAARLAVAGASRQRDRHLLILAYHPELQDAIENQVPELKLHGETVNPQLHVTLHEIVANQLWDDNPRRAWRTAQRLLGR